MRKGITFLILFACIGVQAQLLDTSSKHLYRPLEVRLLNEESLDRMVTMEEDLDTTLNQFQDFYPVYRNDFPFIDQGLEGSSVLLLSNDLNRESGMHLGISDRKPYFFETQTYIYETERPFTRFNYSQGSNEMLSITAHHAQQISKRLSFGIDYRRLKNLNIYYSNLANNRNVRMSNLFNTRFYTGYYTPDRRYEVLATYLWNKSRNAETGGMTDPDRFGELSGRNKLNNNAIALSNAFGSEHQNRISVHQYFRPHGLSTDSTRITTLEQFKRQYFLKTSLNAMRYEFEDRSPDSTYYGFDLDPYLDSIQHRSFQNELGVSLRLNDGDVQLSFSHSFDHIYDCGYVTNYNNLYANATGHQPMFGRDIAYRFNTGLAGYNQGDIHLGMQIMPSDSLFMWTVQGEIERTEPNYLEQYYNSSGVQWFNQFSKINTVLLKGSLGVEGEKQQFWITPAINMSNGMIYYKADTSIAQYGETLNIMSLTSTYSYHSRNFGTDLKAIYQKVNEAGILPRPELAVSGNIYTGFNMFRKNLYVQLGVKTYWFSEFNAPQYNPITRNWHITDTAFNMTPPVNVYVNSKVKSFNIGVEVFHTQMGLDELIGLTDNGFDYFSSPRYPMMSRIIRLNIRWDLPN